MSAASSLNMGARWLDQDGKPFDLIGALHSRGAKQRGFIDLPVWIGRKEGTALALRLVAQMTQWLKVFCR